MSSQPDLVVDWCSYEAAKWAVMKWHYSGLMPSTRTKPVKLGMWENNDFIGCVIFTMGVSASLAKPYGLGRFEVCELQRVALRDHITPTTKIISHSIRKIRRQSPGLRLIVSFADPYWGHRGIVYAAGNWFYSGMTSPSHVFIDRAGKECHPRTVKSGGSYDKFGNTMRALEGMVKREKRPAKYRYLYPLDRAMRKQILPLAQPYPKRASEAKTVNAPAVQAGKRQGRADPDALIS